MASRSIPEKVKKRIFQEALMVCPMCGETDVTTFEIHHIQPFSETIEHEEENLILLCSNCHSKVTAEEVTEAMVLRLKLSLVRGKHPFKSNSTISNVINISGSINTGVVANKIEIKTQKKTIRLSAPEGSLAASVNHRNYIKYLIDRYHEFKVSEVGKEKMNYRILYSAINRVFRAKWDMVPLSKFEMLAEYLQKRIDNTIVGKNMKAKDHKRYSTYDEYLRG